MEKQNILDCVNGVLPSDARAPRSTYRLQLNAGFTFADAESILPYLKELGISDCYASPIFEARPGSMHGYDVTRHDRFNPELGGDEGFERLSAALRQHDMGLLLDIVPNHMGVGNDSIWWQDVLENGRASEYADYFDIDWDPPKSSMKGKLLLPILGGQYGEELEAGHIQVALLDGALRVQYFDHLMPLAPRSLPTLFPESKYEQFGVSDAFRALLRDLAHIPPHDTPDAALAAQRRNQLGELKPRLRAAIIDPAMRPALERAIKRVNGVAGDSRSFDRLHELLEQQPYRLAFWRVSGEEINYRRFFDVNDLVGLRMENPKVFAATHCLIRRLLGRHQVTGLRIDHCDGLFNPRQYLIRLQLLYVASQCGGEVPHGPVAPNGIEQDIRELLRGYDWASAQGPLYVVVEKILEPREVLPREWPVRGTSGYDFVYFGNQIFIRQKNEKRFTDFYTSLIGGKVDPDEIIYRSKLSVMNTALSSETYVLANLLGQIAAEDRRARDFTGSLLERAIRETIACFPVYRTYIDDRGQYTDRDRAFIHQAIARAKKRNSEVDASAFDFLERTLLLKECSGGEVDPHELYFALKFQQLTGPVMAKGVEDTSFYVYNRFVSANEVGSSMKVFGISSGLFHEANRERLKHSPDAMLGTSTHDTKRSEDVRNRLNVLSELTTKWPSYVRRWTRMNARFKRTMEDGRVAPDANEEYLIYQTLIGTWPWRMKTEEAKQEYLDRIKQYLQKALSEAKVNTSWTNPDPAYIEAVQGFVQDILATEGRFVQTVRDIMPQAEIFGAVNSLAQVVLKVASPGVPDFYQGSEMWDLSLVDPDNRRPVDYDLRSRALKALRNKCAADGELAVCRDVLDNFGDGRVKLWTVHRALKLREHSPEAFRRGEYTELKTSAHQEHVLAFSRGNQVLAVVPLFACSFMKNKPEWPIGPAWKDAALLVPEMAGTEMENVFTGERLRIGNDGRAQLRQVLAHFPVALLVKVAQQQ